MVLPKSDSRLAPPLPVSPHQAERFSTRNYIALTTQLSRLVPLPYKGTGLLCRLCPVGDDYLKKVMMGTARRVRLFEDDEYGDDKESNDARVLDFAKDALTKAAMIVC